MNYYEYNLIVFGSSSGGRKVLQTLESLNYKVEFLVDNDSKKWGGAGR